MELIYLGKELDTTKEHELFSRSKHGFKVRVVYKLDSPQSQREGIQAIKIMNNCTEVHYLYKSDYENEEKIAFESNIHLTGCTQNVGDIERVVIENAIRKEKKY